MGAAAEEGLNRHATCRDRGMPKMPSTLKRSPAKAQRTYAKTLESAEREYGPGERAGRTAYAAVKHGFRKVGDHWEAKPPAAKKPKK